MRVRFWGTRGSIATAGPSTVRYGGNTSCVAVESEAGTLVVLDCGTGAHGLSQWLGETGRGRASGHILITHTHWDHIQGFPFFAPLRVADSEWHVYGPRGVDTSLRDALAGQMQYLYFPVPLEGLAANVHYHDLVEGQFEIADIVVTAQYLNHPALTLGFRLEVDDAVLVYATDHEPHSEQLALGREAHAFGEDEKHARFLSGADLVIHDAQYTAAEYPARRGWGHGTVESVVDTALAAAVRRLALFHHDPSRDDLSLDRLLAQARERADTAGGSLEIMAAAEGVSVEVEGARPTAEARGRARDPEATSLPTGLANRIVVVASADPALNGQLADAVRADGLRLLPASRAEQALELARGEEPALLILGHDLARDSVLDACRRIRALPDSARREVPIVLVREREDRPEQEIERQAGVTDWLVHPFSEEYARTRVRAWVLRTSCRWVSAPLPADEAARLAALEQLEILDSQPEDRFDRYTRIATALFDVPIALVSLVDADRQWFKARVGLDAAQTPRDRAFCAHAILEEDVLQIPDALQDPRFADNPLVTGAPHMRFYAGVPLRLPSGRKPGTLCLIDRRARRLDEKQLGLLRDLARLVEREFQPVSHAAAVSGSA